jgi:hypothetical protein
MANTILTPTAVTREAVRIAHEMLSFTNTTSLQYDASFAKSGGKIGENLKIRLPNKYTVRTGKNLNAQDTTEESVTLAVATQKGVDMVFSSAELTLEMDDFSKRILRPAMAVLCSNIESAYMSYVTKKVFNAVGTAGTLPTFAQIGLGRAKLNQNLAPKDGERSFQMESVDMAGIVGELKGLFHDSKEVAKQYREGMVGRALGMDWYENERVYAHTLGADISGTINDTLVAGDNTMTTASVTMTAGDVFDLGTTCKAVHPETKATLAHNAQFVCTVATSGNSITFYPPIYASGPLQNVSALPASGQAITVYGTTQGTVVPQHLMYHKEAFALATADLEMPSGVDFAAREVFDGLSIRVVRQYDISSDNFPCRIDILHGYEAIRPEWACRVYGDY